MRPGLYCDIIRSTLGRSTLGRAGRGCQAIIQQLALHVDLKLRHRLLDGRTRHSTRLERLAY